MPAPQAKSWCFTLNNPTDADEWQVEGIAAVSDYLVVGIETGESGTKHFQGFVVFASKKSLNQCKQFLTRAHWEVRRGTMQQAADYCKKDGDFKEWGTLPVSRADAMKGMWKQMIDWAEEGRLDEIKEEYPAMYLRYLEKFRSLARPERAILPELTNEWWYGPTGTGKSRKLWTDYPVHYAKQLNKWWDGYDGEEVVAIEEWCPRNECTASLLKIWADRYPFPAEIKGGKLNRIRPKKIIVLSNYSPDQCFTAVEDLEPIRRRFTVIHFPMLFQPRFVPETAISNDELDALNSLLSL